MAKNQNVKRLRRIIVDQYLRIEELTRAVEQIADVAAVIEPHEKWDRRMIGKPRRARRVHNK